MGRLPAPALGSSPGPWNGSVIDPALSAGRAAMPWRLAAALEIVKTRRTPRGGEGRCIGSSAAACTEGLEGEREEKGH